jgi:uncharacterized protein YjdB
MRKCLALLLMMCLLLPFHPALGEASPGAEAVARVVETGTTYPSLADALNAAESDGTVEVLRDVDLSAPIDIARTVTLLASKDVSIRRAFAGNRPMVKILEAASLTLLGKGGVLTLDGRGFAGSANSVVSIEGGGALRIEAGATLTGGNTQYGGGVYNRTGTVEVAGGRVAGNIAQRGGGVFSEAGTVLVSGGEITENRVTFDGGGILSNKGSVSVSGGEISGNFAGGMGGGVCSRARLELSGGRIGRNQGTSGGGVYNNSTFKMTGGLIEGNASQAGGGLLNGENGAFDLTGGSIRGNTSTGMGGGLFNQGACTVDGGEIADNTASSMGGGVNNLGTLTLKSGVIKGNKAQRGGGVHQGGSLTVTGGGFESNQAELGGGIYATANSGTTLLDTADPFVDSVLYFEKAPIVNQTVRLTLTGNAAGAVAVQRGEWAEEGWFQLSGMPGSALKQVPLGGSYALRLFQATETSVEAANIRYGEAPAPTASVMAGGASVPGAKAAFSYAPRPEGPFADILPADAGSYWVKARYEGDDQAFLMPSEGVSPFDILPATPTVALGDLQLPYTGQPVSIGSASVTGTRGEVLPGEISYAYYSDPACGDDSLLPSPPVAPGEYYVKATAAAGMNYAAATSVAAKLTIGKLTGLKLIVPEGAAAEGDGYKLIVSDAVQLAAQPTPAWADYPVQYTSSDARVAAVDENGLVKAVGEGQATLTAAMISPADGERFESSATFRVANEVARVELPAEVQVFPGKTRKLSAKLSPATAPDKVLAWTVDAEPGIASVDAGGTVTAGDRLGVAAVTATAANGRSASCNVYVTSPAKGVSVRSQSGAAAVEVNGTLQLVAEALPESAYQRVNWTSTNKYTASVDENGLVRAIQPGRVTITATAKDGTKVAGTFALEVVSPVSALALPETATVLTGKSLKLTAKISPKNATDKALRWASDNPCAKVSADGVVTGVSNGAAVVTATSESGVTASCAVTVKTLPESILLTAEGGQTLIYPGETVKLNAAFIPSDASEVKLTWRSTVYRIAKSNDKGEVTAYRPGKATITAEAAEGGATGSIALTVLSPAPSISLNAENAALSLNGDNKTLLLTASSPKGTQFRALNWAVASGSAVIVDNGGLVTAVAEGEALVRATTDLGVYAECAVTVRAQPAH